MESKIELKVNGKPIALNPFVQKILSHILLGAIASLDKIPQPMRKIEISLHLTDKQEVSETT